MWCRWSAYLAFTQETRVRVPASEASALGVSLCLRRFFLSFHARVPASEASALGVSLCGSATSCSSRASSHASRSVRRWRSGGQRRVLRAMQPSRPVNSAVGNGHSDEVEALPRCAAHGAEPIACAQSFAPRGVNRVKPGPSSAMRHQNTCPGAARGRRRERRGLDEPRGCVACLVERIGLFAEALRRRVQPRCRACAQVLP